MQSPQSPQSAISSRKTQREQPKRVSVTIDETCHITGLGRTKVYELINQRRLKAVAIGRRRLVIYTSIEALLGGAG